MMLIRCPECGPRNENEFGLRWARRMSPTRPQGGADLTDAQWAQYLFFRDNPRRVSFAERWVHSAGCRRWFNAVRDTVSYEILAVYRAGDPSPDLSGPVVVPS